MTCNFTQIYQGDRVQFCEKVDTEDKYECETSSNGRQTCQTGKRLKKIFQLDF